MSENNLMDVFMSIRIQDSLEDLTQLRDVLAQIIQYKNQINESDTDVREMIPKVTPHFKKKKIKVFDEVEETVEQKGGKFSRAIEEVISAIKKAKEENSSHLKALEKGLGLNEEETKELYTMIKKSLLNNIFRIMEEKKYGSEFKAYKKVLENFVSKGPLKTFNKQNLNYINKSLDELKYDILGKKFVFKHGGAGTGPQAIKDNKGNILGYVSANERTFKRPTIPSEPTDIITSKEINDIKNKSMPFRMSSEREIKLQSLLMEKPKGYNIKAANIIHEQISESGRKFSLKNFPGMNLPERTWREMFNRQSEFFRNRNFANLMKKIIDKSSNTLRIVLKENSKLDDFINNLNNLGMNEKFTEQIRDVLLNKKNTKESSTVSIDILGENPKVEEIFNSALAGSQVFKFDFLRMINKKISSLTNNLSKTEFTKSGKAYNDNIEKILRGIENLRKQIKSDNRDDEKDISMVIKNSVNKGLKEIIDTIKKNNNKRVF